MIEVIEKITGEEIVALSAHDFAKLIRESERLAIIKEFARKSSYISADDLKKLLGIGGEE